MKFKIEPWDDGDVVLTQDGKIISPVMSRKQAEAELENLRKNYEFFRSLEHIVDQQVL